MALLIRQPEFKEMMAEYSPENFRSAEHREILGRWLVSSSTEELRDALDQSLHDRLESLINTEIAVANYSASERALDQCLRRLQKRRFKELQETLLDTGDESTPPPRDLELEITNSTSARARARPRWWRRSSR